MSAQSVETHTSGGRDCGDISLTVQVQIQIQVQILKVEISQIFEKYKIQSVPEWLFRDQKRCLLYFCNVSKSHFVILNASIH